MILLQIEVRDCNMNWPNFVRHGITLTFCSLPLTSVLTFDFVVDDDPGVRNTFEEGVVTIFLNEKGVMDGWDTGVATEGGVDNVGVKRSSVMDISLICLSIDDGGGDDDINSSKAEDEVICIVPGFHC